VKALTHEQLPRVKLVVGRDHHRGPGCYNFGFMWQKAKEPREGWLAYERVGFEGPVPCGGMQGFWNYEGEVDHGPRIAGVPPPPPFSLVADDPGGAGDREAR
jgi:hypothetical protein